MRKDVIFFYIFTLYYICIFFSGIFLEESLLSLFYSTADM